MNELVEALKVLAEENLLKIYGNTGNGNEKFTIKALEIARE